MKLFLSYAQEDKDAADLIGTRLQTDGHEIFNWMAPSQRGRRFIEEIEKGMQGADAFIALLSPRFLASDWCRREVEMAIQREGDLRSRDPRATFINVVTLVATVRQADAGVLGSYDWTDMASPEKHGTAPAELAARFPAMPQPEVIPPPEGSSGGSSSVPPSRSSLPSQPGDSVPSEQDESVFRNREDELHKVVHGVTTSGGPHFWLVVAPPQLGKTWLLNRIAADPALSGEPAWIVRRVDARLEPPDVHRNAAALLTRLFELPRPVTTAPEALRGIAQAIIRSGRPHLCLLDSAELLSAETARDLRNCMSQIYHFVRKAPKKGNIQLAFIVAGRDNKEWKGVIPRPSLTPLPLSEFTPDVVQDALVDLAAEMGFPQSDILNYAPLVHRLTEGLPALLAPCLRWIRDEEGVDMERLQTRELFEQFSYPYIKQELLTPESLLPYGQRQDEESLRALVQAYGCSRRTASSRSPTFGTIGKPMMNSGSPWPRRAGTWPPSGRRSAAHRCFAVPWTNHGRKSMARYADWSIVTSTGPMKSALKLTLRHTNLSRSGPKGRPGRNWRVAWWSACGMSPSRWVFAIQPIRSKR